MRVSTMTFFAAFFATHALGCNDKASNFFESDQGVQSNAGAGGSTAVGAGGKTTSVAGGGAAGTAAAKDAGGLPVVTVDRSGLTDVGTSGSLDYSQPGMWACRPDMEPNICNSNLEATLIKSDGSRETVVHEQTENPYFDCFYVYPTVLLTGAAQMVDFSEVGITMVSDPLLTQGARFSRLCRMYAPMYRQIGLTTSSGSLGMAEGADRALALQDVRDAFAYYLKTFNRGRRFVLIGHSQGTGMLTAMIQKDIDPEDKADVRKRMISALLIGGAVTVPPGEKVGGTYKNIPLCSAPGDTGCVITYASFASDKPPAEGSMFGSTTEEGMKVACTNPADLSGNTGRYLGSYFRKEIANASFTPNTPLPQDIGTPFALYRDLFKGECATTDSGAVYLKITLDTTIADDKRTPPWRNTNVEAIGMGLHLVDYQIPLEDLIQAVKKQADQVAKAAASP
jgi:hypothetical protein